jgi:hypothetical protein
MQLKIEMKKQPFLKHLLWLTLPLVTTSITIPASHAATFSLSSGEAELFNFNLNPIGTSTDTDVDTFVSGDTPVTAFADADATFLVNPAFGSNSSVTQAFGSGREYLGLAESQAEVVGNFWVEDEFTFDFKANLQLATAIDNPQREQAKANGNFFFFVVDNANPDQILDAFNLEAGLDSGGQDFLRVDRTAGVQLNEPNFETAFGGTDESASATVSGSFKRAVGTPTQFTLVEVKANQANVKEVPEPSTIFASLASGAAIFGLRVYRKRKNKQALEVERQ